ESAPARFEAAPLLGEPGTSSQRARTAIVNPADRGDTVGSVEEASRADVDRAVATAASAGGAWSRTPAAGRADRLERAARLLERERGALVSLAVREAGETPPDALG